MPSLHFKFNCFFYYVQIHNAKLSIIPLYMDKHEYIDSIRYYYYIIQIQFIFLCIYKLHMNTQIVLTNTQLFLSYIDRLDTWINHTLMLTLR